MAVLSNTFTIFIETTSDPAWFAGQTDKTWQAIGGNTLADIDPENDPVYNPNYPGESPWHRVEGQSAVMNDWCGGAYSPHSLIIAAQGGHDGYDGNEVYEFTFTDETPLWVMRVPPSTNIQDNVGYYPDGKPAARHGYKNDCFIPDSLIAGGRYFSPHGSSLAGDGNNATDEPYSFQPGASAYDPQGTFANFVGRGGFHSACAFDAGAGLVWMKDNGVFVGSEQIHSFNPVTNTWATYNNSVLNNGGGSYYTAAVDTDRNLFVCWNGRDWGDLQVFDLSDPNAPGRDMAAGDVNGTWPPSTSAPGLVYHPPSNAFLVWMTGATLYKLTPGANPMVDNWQWSTVSNNAGGDTPTARNFNGTFGRFGWVQDLDALATVNYTNEQVYVYKLPAGGV